MGVSTDGVLGALLLICVRNREAVPPESLQGSTLSTTHAVMHSGLAAQLTGTHAEEHVHTGGTAWKRAVLTGAAAKTSSFLLKFIFI